MRSLSITQILEYYDVPQLFIAEDTMGVRYLCMLYDMADDGELKIIGVTVSAEKLNDFIKGKIDLLTIFSAPEKGSSLFIVHFNEEGLFAEPYTGDLDNSMLPDEGYFYNDSLSPQLTP